MMNSIHWPLVLTLMSSARLFADGEPRRPATYSSRLKIIGGIDTLPDEQKYVVGINCNRYGCRCTGSIIGERFVVSAAHCFLDGNLKFHFYPVRIVAGINNVGNYTDPRRVEMNVDKIYVPAGFNRSYENDIAVLKLRRNLQLKKNNLQKLRLPAKTSSGFVGEQAVLLGFGVSKITYTVRRNKTVEEFHYPNAQLRSANITIVPNDVCNDTLVVDSNLCGKMIKMDKWDKHYGACSGDSGGPLVYKSKVLIGVFIFGPPTCNERLDAGVYTRVKSHIDFIEKAMKDETSGMIFKNY